jgi:hypothetical protein
LDANENPTERLNWRNFSNTAVGQNFSKFNDRNNLISKYQIMFTDVAGGTGNATKIQKTLFTIISRKVKKKRKQETFLNH